MRTVLAIPLGSPNDHLLASRRTRDLAGLVGLTPHAQARLIGAVAEVVEGAVVLGADASLDFALEEAPGRRALSVTISGVDPDALTPGGQLPYLDLAELRNLVDRAEARGDGATAVLRLTCRLDDDAFLPSPDDLTRALQAEPAAAQVASMEELRRRNAELVQTLSALQARERELLELNRQLSDTNAGVLGLLAELDHTTDELRRQAASKTRFLRTVSHELRTPLYAARGLLEELAMAEGLNEQDKSDVALLDGTVDEALALVNDQLDLARLETGRTIVRVGPVHIPELFQQLRGTLRVLTRSDDVQLTFAGEDATAAPMHTDAARLARILRNLVSNALKFTTAGSVHVTATLSADGQSVAFAVADTGIGIAPEDLETIFGEFGQLEPGQDHGLDSSGLGLPLARRIAILLGGTLTVESDPGRGSTFTATVPVRFAPPENVEVEVVETGAATDAG